jgi:hypothetical protein
LRPYGISPHVHSSSPKTSLMGSTVIPLPEENEAVDQSRENNANDNVAKNLQEEEVSNGSGVNANLVNEKV